MPTLSAGPLMPDKADPRQAHSIALITSEGLVGVGVWVRRFFFQSFTTSDFKVIVCSHDVVAVMLED